ncbi:DUF4145 domain-containing protein [Parahaliea aestuarii]|uniref:DUF4145 domain-containing protein n=1 Tax=Parahaliea aestuarii TaxID=1852021 RepID=A0A5C8ZXU7_9GAMM|nr:DUF4145 domain-containing protein [Parahaliea aestuarii]TXS93413.1 DUF4145 domain-containing protein [Parahaliea aestuarii]
MSITLNGVWLQQLNIELEGSDRSCAVLGGAVLDDRLAKLIKKFLLPPKNEKEDRLLGRGRAVESFSARIELARRLNLVAEEVSRSLDWIRDIRNDAAHREEFSFEENSCQSRVENIIEALELKTYGPGLLECPYASPKGHFIVAVTMIVARIELETESVNGTLHDPIRNHQISIGA